MVPLYVCAGNPQEIAQKVLDRLYQVHGNSNPRKPKLEIINSKQNVAMYIKHKNTIQLEEQAYLFCRFFGKDSLDALAFILGHELIHAIQTNNVLPKTSFISYDKTLNSSFEIEQNADIQGIFVSYLAGYKTIQLIPQIIEKMYTVYELRKKNLNGYPTEEERKTSYKPVIDQVNELIELFHLANELSVIEEFEASIQCLEYISRFYQGKEIYNNLGINYALMALNFTKTNAESYIYPLELDWNIRIKKPKTGRGDDPLEILEKIEQMQLYRKSKDYFQLASQLDPNYTLVDLNTFCVLIMMNDLQNAKQFYRNQLRAVSSKIKDTDVFLKIKAAHAILLAKMNNPSDAIKIWTDLSKQNNEMIAAQAEQNLVNVSLNKQLRVDKPLKPCVSIDLKGIPQTSIKLRNIETDQWIQMDTFNHIEKKKYEHSTLYAFISNDRKILNTQKIYTPSKPKLTIEVFKLHSLGNKQWIYQCKKENIAYILNEHQEVQYLIRHYRFKEMNQ